MFRGCRAQLGYSVSGSKLSGDAFSLSMNSTVGSSKDLVVLKESEILDD
jgi:hypothetical protein